MSEMAQAKTLRSLVTPTSWADQATLGSFRNAPEGKIAWFIWLIRGTGRRRRSADRACYQEAAGILADETVERPANHRSESKRGRSLLLPKHAVRAHMACPHF